MKKCFTQIMAFVLALTLCFSLLPMTAITAHAAETKTVVGLEITPPTKTVFVKGDSFSTEGLVVYLVYSDGTKEETEDYYVDVPSMSKAGTKTVVIEYDEFSASYEITVVEPGVLERIDVVPPSKTVYQQGEEFDYSDMRVTAVYEDGLTKAVADYDITTPDMNKVGNQTVTVSYQGKTSSFVITVKGTESSKVLTKIEVTPPTKRTYVQGETFDKSGMVVTAIYDNGSSEVVTDYEITDPDMNAVGTQIVTVSYQGKTYAFDITIEKYVEPVVLEKIQVKAPTKTVYEQGDVFSTDGMIVTAVYSNGSREDVTDYQVSVPDMSKLGEQTITVTYEGYSTTFTITVNKKVVVDPVVTKIEVTPPTKLTYVQGEKFDKTGMVITAIYDDGSRKVIDNEYKYTMTEPDMNLVGIQVVTVTYEGKSDSFEITIEKYEAPIVLEKIQIKAPTKTVYEQGDVFTTDGMIVTAVYSNGSRKEVEDYLVSVPDMNKLGDQTITVSYENCNATFTITINKKTVVEPVLTKIEVTPPAKLTYVTGEEFDKTGMVVTAIFDDGSRKVIDNEYKYTMTTPDMNLVGVQVVTITYEGKSDHFEITVVAEEIEPEIHCLEITREPHKTVYYQGETLDPTGLIVTVRYKNGSFEEVTNYDLTGYDMNRLGYQTVTVTHRTHSTSFRIEVISEPQCYMTNLTISQQPKKIIYTLGEEFTADGIVVTAHFNNGTYELVEDFDMSTPDMTRLGRQEVIVSYGGYKDSFVITILAPEGLPFVDVHTSDWFYDEVHWAYYQGIMAGVSNSRFDPNGVTTRAMICVILYRMAGSPEEIVANPMPFSDVPDGKWYSDAITWCSGRGIVSGYGNGKFGPNDKITREQMAAMLYRYAQYAGVDVSEQAGLNGFNDYKQIDKYAITPMAWCVAEGIITGTGNNNLSPNKGATRAEVATMMCRFYNMIYNPCCPET